MGRVSLVAGWDWIGNRPEEPKLEAAGGNDQQVIEETMSDILVRQARREDREALLALLERSWRAHWAPHVDATAVARFDEQMPVEAYVDGYLERFRVAEGDGVVLGMYHLEGDHLHAIHVDVSAIGSGVGRALMDEAEATGARKLEVRKSRARVLCQARVGGSGGISRYGNGFSGANHRHEADLVAFRLRSADAR
ncbi:MAG: hypothetical protein GX970_07875 [Phyllobacteriaceae bacterium]|nr:hypothetical protein [Phyllobacteriaceae bacterium]